MAINKRLIKSNDEGAVVPTGFNTVLYTGNGSTQSISTVGFQPDLVWIKERTQSVYSHILCDSVRGGSNTLFSNLTTEELLRNSVLSFDSNGFTIGDYGNVNASDNNKTYVAWCWKAGGAAVSNTDGTITSTVSANPDAGFSIVKWTAPSSGTNARIGHGLSAAPEIIFYKRTDSTSDWYAFTTAIDGSYDFLKLNTTAAKTDDSSTYLPNSTTISSQNFTSSTWISYCFHSVDGYQKVGSYTASGSWGTSATIDVGFPPRFVLIKSIDNTGSWLMVDSLRGGSNGQDRARLYANSSGAEGADTSVDFSGNTFSITFGSTGNQGTPNVSRYIYLAIA